MYALAIFALLMIVLGSWMSWEAVRYFLHLSDSRNEPASAPAAAASTSFARLAPWQQEAILEFDQAAQQAKAGNVAGAEMQVDGAVARMEEARVRSKAVAGDFFERASTDLDGIMKAWADSPAAAVDARSASSANAAAMGTGGGRLFEHVAQARIELAALRSWQSPIPPGSELALDAEEKLQGQVAQVTAANGSSNVLETQASAAPQLGKLKLQAGHVAANGPRQLAANFLLDPASLGGKFLDASLMPDTSEILLPPTTCA
jgi:hypothetical protein